jgi:ketol-acid reductoisomerase
MKEILREIQSGSFAREWMAEYEAGAPNLLAARAAVAKHPVEETGRELRDMMTFMDPKTPADDV